MAWTKILDASAIPEQWGGVDVLGGDGVGMGVGEMRYSFHFIELALHKIYVLPRMFNCIEIPVPL